LRCPEQLASAKTGLVGFEKNSTQIAAPHLPAKLERQGRSKELQLRAPTTSNLIALLLFFAQTRHCWKLPQP